MVFQDDAAVVVVVVLFQGSAIQTIWRWLLLTVK
jgi:hypothetical protein